VLSDNGRPYVAFDLLHQTAHPSWLYAVTQGATTIWERWDGWTTTKASGPEHELLQPLRYGAIGAGSTPGSPVSNSTKTKPGTVTFLFKPLLDSRKLNQARANFDSIHGMIISDWRLDGDVFSWKIVVPPNTRAMSSCRQRTQITSPKRNVARETLVFVAETTVRSVRSGRGEL
jgi:alpha-L-rhamnosidase